MAYDIMDFGMDNTGTMIGCYFGTGLGNAMYIDGKEYLEERIKAHCRKPYPASNLKLCFSRPSPVNSIIGEAIRANLKLFN